jgi:hypothetical protein
LPGEVGDLTIKLMIKIGFVSTLRQQAKKKRGIMDATLDPARAC